MPPALPHARQFALAAALIGIGAFVLAALAGPFFSHPAYSSMADTVSELAGQNMPNAWIMRSGFVALGVGVCLAALVMPRTDLLLSAALVMFGAAMVGAAIWSHLPIAQVGGGDVEEDALHSLAANTMGASFAAACGARLWARRRIGVDWLSAAGLAVSIGAPMLMFTFPETMGATQRMMFAFSFVWLVQITRSGDARGPR
jgi:hypothetical protein